MYKHVKIFTNSDEAALEKDINSFIQNKKIIDIKWQGIENSAHNICVFSALIIYEKKDVYNEWD